MGLEGGVLKNNHERNSSCNYGYQQDFKNKNQPVTPF
jgi:hypothetical protein